jgi:uncharacterized protein (TIGR00255 family)
MTGYGKSVEEKQGKTVSVEIRTLNGKQTDINLRTPAFLKEKEPEIRSFLSNRLVRGKIDVFISYDDQNFKEIPEIDIDVAKHYIKQIRKLQDELGSDDNTDYLSLIMKMPEVLVTKEKEIDDEVWRFVFSNIEKAAIKVDDFRKQEGEILKNDLTNRIVTIDNLLQRVDGYEKERIVRIKERIQKHISEFLEGTGANPERLEQEMIYYMEKLDITEEKIRLKKHCDYFLEIMEKEENSGKKLNFVAQEIGREINTLGSKANDADLQRIVVLMKDELEKIKEQLYNIL